MKIDEKIIHRMAPIYFSEVKNYLKYIGNLRNFTNYKDQFNSMMIEFIKFCGVAPVDLLYPYNSSLLNYDEFKIMVIIYASLCIILNKKKITMCEVRDAITSIAVSKEFSSNNMIQFILTKMKIDASIIPSSVKISMANDNEENAANELCILRANLIRNPEMNENFDSYNSYIKESAEKIIEALNKEGYVRNYPIDIFTSLLMLHKLGVNFTKLYKIDCQLPVPKEVLHVMAKKMFQAYSNLPDIIDNDDGYNGP